LRYLFEIAYHGKNYNGWQSQHNGIGVQTVLEQTLSKLLQETIKVVGSGRTDTGVHCEQQFFHTDIEGEFEVPSFLQKLNSFLPRDIVIPNVRRVTAEASARYDAIERGYRYQITRKKNPFLEGLAWHYFKPADIQTMNRAAALLEGAGF
jgi:tRNA pseudouridine38-40 synthase